MADVFTKAKRSEIMSKIGSKNTKPEIAIERILREHGVKFQNHSRKIFGNPDIYDASKKVAIFIDGCFWHGCRTCRTIPKNNREFWQNKICYNKARRVEVKKVLKKNGWAVMEFWEHEVNKNPKRVADSIMQKLKG